MAIKEAAAWFSTNFMNSNFVTKANMYFKTKAGASLARKMGLGAGLGMTYGAFDTIMGEGRTGMVGGAIRGAGVGAAFWGGREMFRKGLARGRGGGFMPGPQLTERAKQAHEAMAFYTRGRAGI
jgi:hypothetical protein